MTSRLAVLALDCLDVEAQARFWRDVLGWDELERGDGLISIGPAGGGSPGLDLLPVPEGKTVKNRLHLDLRADGSAQDELARLEQLGARRVDVGQPPDASWTVLADPEGNEFCLLGTSPA